jgi:hypothetical protein
MGRSNTARTRKVQRLRGMKLNVKKVLTGNRAVYGSKEHQEGSKALWDWLKS